MAPALAYCAEPIEVGCVISIGGFQVGGVTFAGAPPLPPALLLRGKRDKVIGWHQSNRLAGTLERLGVAVTIREFVGAHHVPTDVLLEARLWADEVLP